MLSGAKFQYTRVSKEELATNIKGGKEQFMLDFFNEVGEQGGFIVSVEESFRPSSIAAVGATGGASGGFIPYYIITVFVAKVKEVD